MWVWSKGSARKNGPSAQLVTLTPAFFDKGYVKIMAALGKWRELYFAMKPGCDLFDFYKRENPPDEID